MYITPALSPSDMAHLSLHDHDGSSGGASDQDILHPLPHPGAAPWPMAMPYQFPITHPYNPQSPHDLPQPYAGGPGQGSAGSQHSGECVCVCVCERLCVRFMYQFVILLVH